MRRGALQLDEEEHVVRIGLPVFQSHECGAARCNVSRWQDRTVSIRVSVPRMRRGALQPTGSSRHSEQTPSFQSHECGAARCNRSPVDDPASTCGTVAKRFFRKPQGCAKSWSICETAILPPETKRRRAPPPQ
jgi:hypothetical protein